MRAPRDYQIKAVQDVRTALRSNDAVLLQLPTGGGKTVISAMMMGGAVKKGGRPWFCCHRDFLVDQTSNTLSEEGIDHAFIAAGRRFNPWAAAQVCSIDTLRNRLARVPKECYPTVLFVDEGHHSCSASWSKIIKWAIEVGAKIIGLSATPERLDRKGLDELYGEMVLGPSIRWLIENKFLSDYIAYAPTIPDVSGLSSRGGDYKTEDLEDVMDTDTITGNVVGHYKRVANGKRAVYFAVSVEHSKHVVAAFRHSGISAVHLDASSPSDERRSAARGMAIGEIDVICNVGLFGEGYDLAAQAGMDVTIECVGMLRPTQSLAMYMQQVGRALRPKDYPAIILDHAGNIMRHGLPDDDRQWTLAAKGPKKKASAPGETIKVCPNCFATAAAGKRICPFCEEPYPIKEDRIMKENDEDLIPVDKEQLRAIRAKQEKECESLQELIDVGYKRGYEKPEKWAAHLWTAREQKSRQLEDEKARQRGVRF